MSVSAKFSSESGFDAPGRSGDDTHLHDIYEFSNSIYTATYNVTSTSGDIASVSYSGIDGFSVSNTEKSFTVSGRATNVFNGEFFKFLMPDLKTEKILPRDTTEKFSTIVQWHPPEPMIKTVTHTITITTAGLLITDENGPQDPETVSISLIQDIKWYHVTSVNAFQALLARGTI